MHFEDHEAARADADADADKAAAIAAPAGCASAGPWLSIVMPVLDEAPQLAQRLAALQVLRRRGVELVVADGGSADGSMRIAEPHADQVISAPRGRARQMNAGARAAAGRVLLFLHADTQLPADAVAAIAAAIPDKTVLGIGWGRFDVEIDSPRRLLRCVAGLMNLRSRLTGIATGDQAIFASRALFNAVGGFADIALMEDIDFSRRAKRLQPPVCLRLAVRTSARRWEQGGAWRTIALMWHLRLAYFFGADPKRLARRYGYAAADD
ncbi:MAG: TIGR04283 family arsenosugar biosynthesis glycosyltransferase [Variovorax sp.]